MNKKLLCLLISSFLLSGCANFKKINANELAAERDAQKATEYAKKIRNNPVIQDSTKQWINTTPIIEKQVKQSAPPCPIVINTRSDIELRQAWVYERYNEDESLPALQREAQEQKRGLWADANPVPPWEWRIRN